MEWNLRTWAALAIFAFTYLLISGRQKAWMPIGRPGGALAGAALMVLAGVLPPEEAYGTRIISHDTLGLLLGMMIMGAALDEGGFFGWAAALVDQHVRTPRGLLWATTLLSGGLSALLVNDTVCVVLTPLLLTVVQRRGLPLLPYVLALGFGANVGCALTLTGNPQNMLVGAYSGIPFLTFAARMALPVAIATVITVGLLGWMFRAQLAAASDVTNPPPAGPMPANLWQPLLGLTVALAGFVVGSNMAWSALAGAAVTIMTRGKDPHPLFAKVDFPLLVFFAGLFVVMGGINSVGLVSSVFSLLEPLLTRPGGEGMWHLAWISVVGSQVFSNVPLVQALGPHLKPLANAQPLFLTLGLASTLAGNLTPLGSVANLIVLEYTRKAGLDVGFRQFLRRGIPVTVATTVAGMLVLWLLDRAF
jgi:Na+/H+ antiporter NhaD/arsenite permease-like protein